MSEIKRTTRNRTCARQGCGALYDPFDREDPIPARFCSMECARGKGRASIPTKRKQISPASTGQRLVVQGRACLVCGEHAGHCHPAHVISRAALTIGQDDPRAVVPLCPLCHRAYDEEGLSILEHLEPLHREVLAFAVERYGLLRTLQRVTNTDWAPVVSGVPVEREGRRGAV